MGPTIELLTQKNIQYVEKGKDILIHCLNPEHEDQNPSLRVDRETGIFGCFGCGYSGDIFKYFNRSGPRLTQSMNRVLAAIKEATVTQEEDLGYPSDVAFNVTDFRGLSNSLLKKFKAFRTTQFGMEDRVCLPILDGSGSIRAYLGRHEHSNASPKYLLYPKEVKLPLYPTVNMLTGVTDTIVVVEGLYDALHLINNGITNVTCAFGTKMISMDNVYALFSPFMCAGVERVILLMDGDSAGISAASKIRKALEYKTDLLVETVELGEGEDPGSLDAEQVEMLKNHLNSL